MATLNAVNNHLNAQNYALAEPETIVKKIVDYEKAEHQKEMLEMEIENSPFLELFKQNEQNDSIWEDKKADLYLKIERFIRENPDKIPTWEVASPLHYGMTLSKMKTVIQQKFQEMVSLGQMMTESSLMQTKDRSAFYPEKSQGSNNLTRIWGANFLQSNLKEIPTLDAAEHYLIVDDEVTEIEVQVMHNDYPILATVKNAYILSQKIVGNEAAWNYRFSAELDKLKYRDFKDPGNIIRDSKGIGWIVDTEYKSFDAPTLSRKNALILNYLKKRFKVLTGDDYTFKISLADVGLNTHF